MLLRGLEFYGYHGVIPEENRLGQRFIVDVDMYADTRRAGASDDLDATVNYVAVYEDVKSIVEGAPLKLVESVAERIAEYVLANHPVERVRVRIVKPDVPIPARLEFVGVEIVRGPGDLTKTRSSGADSG